MTDPVTLVWRKEQPAIWDAAKAAVFGPSEMAATGLEPPGAGRVMSDEWWRVEDGDGTVMG